MKNAKLKTVLFVLMSVCLMSGCKVSYSLTGASIDYNKTKTITIETFSNLRQVRRDGDLLLSGEITSYDQTNKSISADGYSSMVQLKMTVKVKFTNNKKHEDDFERSFSASREYDSSQQLSAVQEELVQQMIDDIEKPEDIY